MGDSYSVYGSVGIGLSAGAGGTYNVYVGPYAGRNSQGTGNIGLGFGALSATYSGNYNIAIGSDALAANTTQSYNVAIGYDAGAGGIFTQSIGIGYQVGFEGAIDHSVGIGYAVMPGRVENCVAIGHQAMNSTSGAQSSVAIGSGSMKASVTGGENVAVGHQALYSHESPDNETAIGAYALYSANIDSRENVAVGFRALYANTDGESNVAVGFTALSSNTTGIYNTAIGYQAGNAITVGTNLTCLGYNAQASAVDATDEITLGDDNIATLRCNQTTISALSDARDKADISDFNVGLELLGRVIPRQWHWDKREWYLDGKPDGSQKKAEWDYGFVAQELDVVQKELGIDLGLVYKSNPDKLEATPGKLLTVCVRAIQELAARVARLEEK